MDIHTQEYIKEILCKQLALLEKNSENLSGHELAEVSEVMLKFMDALYPALKEDTQETEWDYLAKRYRRKTRLQHCGIYCIGQSCIIIDRKSVV